MTAQIHERLIVNGDETSMAFCPPLPVRSLNIDAGLGISAITGIIVWIFTSFLLGYITAIVALVLSCVILRKRGHPRIAEISPFKIVHNSILSSSACWRGYQGTWEIKDGFLYLVNLRGRFQLKGEEPLLADWFSGVLRIPKGEVLQYVHMGFGSVFEQEIHIKIVKGKVVTSMVFDNRGKQYNKIKLAWRNLPGGENRFTGDDQM